MNRTEFIEKVGVTALSLTSCLGLLVGCSKSDPVPAPTNVDFTLDVSSGVLSKNGGYLVHSGVLVARTLAGSFIAVSAACTHQGTTVQYESSQNDFYCPNHGAMFSATGSVTRGPASRSLAQYNTALTGTSLRVFS